MTVGERIHNRRLELSLSVDELSTKLGKNRATIYRYESNDIENLPVSVLEPLAKVLETTPAYLMGWASDKDSEVNQQPSTSKKKGIKIPVLGRVAAGIPIEAIEDVIDEEEITEEMTRTGEYFGLQIRGDSMTPKIDDGDIVIVRQQTDAENGELVIAIINGEDATCKRLRKYKDGIELVASNPSYPPMFFSNRDIDEMPVVIVGKVVELRAKL